MKTLRIRAGLAAALLGLFPAAPVTPAWAQKGGGGAAGGGGGGGKLSVVFPGVCYRPTVWSSQGAGRSAARVGSASLTPANGDPGVRLFGKNGGISGVITDASGNVLILASGNVLILASGTYPAPGGP